MHCVNDAAGQTSLERNRVVDTWRTIALHVVVLGHWLAASVWTTPGGDTIIMNTLDWIPTPGGSPASSR